ncbi:MAG: methyltransferase domain-containing protein [Acidobacteria bacterium]|nr:methyltransferase domain-containing protein [Acidobacteriota bacterium]
MRESLIKGRLVEQLKIEKGDRVLDIGCGTGTLALMIKKRHADAEIIGLDGDPGVLAIATKKAAKLGVEIGLDCGMGFALPYPDGFFDRVVSSLMLHHLTRDNKKRALAEARRVLRPGGQLHIADFGRPRNSFLRKVSLPALLGDPGMVRDNLDGRLPEIIRDAGFAEVRETEQFLTLFGTVSLYAAVNTDEPAVARISAEVRNP